MGISKAEINLRRLLAAAPNQQNQRKLTHYVATLREQLEELAEEETPDGLLRVSKMRVNDYLEKIEAIASKLAVPVREKDDPELPSFVPDSDIEVVQLLSSTFDDKKNRAPSLTPPIILLHRREVARYSLESWAQVNYTRISKAFCCNSVEENLSKTQDESPILTSPRLRRRFAPQTSMEDKHHNSVETDHSAPVKLDAAARTHIEKHRKLQEDLTDEMVGLGKQLKERSLTMNQSIKNTENILDSTEKAVEHSLASTGHVNTRTVEIYSKSFKTTCFTWLSMFVMTCIFIMVVLLIRVT